MKKIVLSGLILCLGLQGCGILNVHNLSNQFLWKNRKLKDSLRIQLNFEPQILKEFTAGYTYFLEDYFKDSLDINTLRSSLLQKLENRNFIVDESAGDHRLVVETIVFQEKEDLISVHSDDQEEYLGRYEAYAVQLTIKGFLVLDVKKYPIHCSYEFAAEPRPGFIFKNTMTYGNRYVQIDRVLENLFNQFSHECYQLVDAEMNPN